MMSMVIGLPVYGTCWNHVGWIPRDATVATATHEAERGNATASCFICRSVRPSVHLSVRP